MDALCYHHGHLKVRQFEPPEPLCADRRARIDRQIGRSPRPAAQRWRLIPRHFVPPAWTRRLLRSEAACVQRREGPCATSMDKILAFEPPSPILLMTPIPPVPDGLAFTRVLPAWTSATASVAWRRAPQAAACCRHKCATSMVRLNRNPCEQRGRSVPAAWTLCATSGDAALSTFLARQIKIPTHERSNEVRFVAMNRADHHVPDSTLVARSAAGGQGGVMRALRY
jgi:hypothetical protein